MSKTDLTTQYDGFYHIDDPNLNNYIHSLNRKRLENEFMDHAAFEGFTDYEMISYYVFDKKSHLHEANKNTQKSYFYVLNGFMDFIYRTIEKQNENTTHNVNINRILPTLKPYHLEFYLNYICPTNDKGENIGPYKNSTVSTYMTIVKQFFRYLYLNNYIDHDITRRLKSTSLKDSDRPNRDIQLNELQYILHKLQNDPYKHPIVLLLIVTGLRITAAVDIKMSDISFENVQGTSYYVIGVREKGDVHREVVVKKEFFDKILEHRRARRRSTQVGEQGEGYLFCKRGGEKYNSDYMSTEVTKWLNNVGINDPDSPINRKISPHYLRHGYAIYLHSLGYSMEQIQLSLMHKSISTTRIYLNSTLSKEQDLGSAINISDFL